MINDPEGEGERDADAYVQRNTYAGDQKADFNNNKFLPTRKIWEGIILTRQLLVG